MALSIGDNFSYQGTKPNFERDTFKTLLEMKLFSEKSIDEGHLSFCLEDGKHYEYKASNPVDPTTGRWRIFLSGVTEETDPTVPEWAKTPEKPKYTASEVGAVEEALNDSNSYVRKGKLWVKETTPDVTKSYVDLQLLGKLNAGDYALKSDLPKEYILPIASKDILGGIKVGAGLQINPDSGVLSATGGGTADSVDWLNITSKPDTFPPSEHTHSQYLTEHLDISGKVDKENGKSLLADTEIQRLTTLKNYDDTLIKKDIADIDKTKLNSITYNLDKKTFVTKEVGKGLSTNDYTTLEKQKLESLKNYNDEPIRGLITTLLTGKADKTEIKDMLTKTEASTTYLKVGNYATKEDVAKKLDTLISGTTIKTINGTSVLGKGNIEIKSSENVTSVNEIEVNDTGIAPEDPNVEIWVDLNENLEINIIEEAPNDGKLYTRGNKQWKLLPIIPNKTSELTNDNNFINNTVNNLTNYYTKTQTYTQLQVNELIGAITTINFKKVEVKPNLGEANIIYLVKDSLGVSNNLYEEWIYIDSKWELIGTTKVNLSDYYTQEQVNQALALKADKSEIPTKTSQLINDSNFINKHQSLIGYATKEELKGYQVKGNYLESIPPEYVTESELALKGFLTEHQDISSKLDKAVYDVDKPKFALKTEIANEVVINNTGIAPTDPETEIWVDLSSNEIIETENDRPATPTSMGYKVLKKDLTFAEQVTEPNTIYEIRDSFDLTTDGKGAVTIPIDCTLKFNGGSIKNGTIVFKNTRIEGDAKFINIIGPEIGNTLANEDIYMDWFERTKKEYATYDTSYLKFFLYLGLDGKHHNIHIGKKTLVVKSCLIFNPTYVINNLTFIGDTINSIIEVDKTINRTNWEEVLRIKGSSNIEFNGIKFIAPGMQSVENNPQFASTVLNLENCKNSKILNCVFDEMPYISPIMLTMPQDITIKGNTFKEYDSGVILHDDGTRNETDIPESDDLITYRVEVCNNVFTGEYIASEPITFKSNRIFDLRIHDNIIENKTQAAGISLKLPHSKSKCLISNNIIRNCDDGICIEFSRATFTITGNVFIKSGHNHIRIYDKANTINIIGNIFKADGGTTMVVGTQTNVAESWVTCSNNIFEGCGAFKGNCNFVITHNTFTRNLTANGYLLMAVSDITFVGNVSDRSDIIYKIEYQSPVNGKKKINIRDNNFNILLKYINDINIDESSFIELSRPIILWKGTELNYNLIQNKNSNTLYIIE